MVGFGRHIFTQLTLSTGSFPVSCSLWMHGLGIWRGALFRTTEITSVVLQRDLLKGIHAPPSIPNDMSGVAGSQREVGAQLRVFRIYAELYRDGMLHKYFSKTWGNILIRETP